MTGRPMLRPVATVAAFAAIITATASCSSVTPGKPGQAPTTPQTTSAETRISTPVAGASAFTGFLEPLSGTEGNITYQVDLPQLRGGDAAVRDRFNARMRAALDDYLKPAEDAAPTTIAPGQLADEAKSAVSHIGSGAVAGVLLVNFYVDRAAHPFNEVATTVIDARTAKPIMITDLFNDETVGLIRLTDAITAKIATDERLAGQQAPEPVADQLADWLPSPAGLVVYIAVAHVLGDYYPVLVAWDDITDVLVPEMREKLCS